MIAVIGVYYKENWGTSALIIDGSKYDRHRIGTTCISPGHPKDQAAYRSELEDRFHVVSVVEYISLKSNISEGAIKISCDGLNEIKKSMGSETRYLCLSNRFGPILVVNKKP